MNCNTIHETVIRDIIDIVHDVKNADELKGLRGRSTSYKSIAQASSNLTLVFPVIISSNNKIENAAMITKALERKAVTMLQMLFSAINITDNADGIEYLRKFHTNLKLDDSVSVDDFMDAIDKFVMSNESVNLSNRELYEAVKRDMNNIGNFLPDNINETSINDYNVRKNMYGESIVEAKPLYRSIHAMRNNQSNNMSPSTNDLNLSISPNINIPSINVKSSNGGGNNSNNSGIDYRNIKNQQDIFRNQLMTTDVKKANELVPTMMTVNFITTGYEENIPTQMVIGVKAKMYPVNSTDLITRLSSKHRDSNGLLKLIRSTTREISFIKDFLFAIDKAKIDALSQSR
ncbi:MAG: hypothetical protein ACRCXT_02125, partial [Paraclostridium sp.]